MIEGSTNGSCFLNLSRECCERYPRLVCRQILVSGCKLLETLAPDMAKGHLAGIIWLIAHQTNIAVVIARVQIK